MFKCENNFLDNSINLKIINVLRSVNFPWYLNEKEKIFQHIFLQEKKTNSNFIDILEPFVNNFNNEMVYGSCILIPQSNANTAILKQSNKFKEDRYIRFFYYLNTSNGHQLITIKEKISFVKNRMVLFDNQLKNQFFTPTDVNQILIEILYEK